MELQALLLFTAAAFVVAAVVVASGFGLGTTLTPLFLLVYDIKTAVLLVAVVHLANNLFKLTLFREHINYKIVRRFGLLSVAGAITGSMLQGHAQMPLLEIGLGILLVVLGGLELLPQKFQWRIPQKVDPVGGAALRPVGWFVGKSGRNPQRLPAQL